MGRVAADDFFQRWAKHNAELRQAPKPDAHESKADSAAVTPVKKKTDALPTLDDVAALTPESDYAPFVARGVDETVQRSAMKKLFSDPCFNVMDGLDTYIEDYNKFEPIPPEMLALLNHAKDLLNPLARFEKPVMQLLAPEKIPEDDGGQESASLPDANAAQEIPPENPATQIPEQAPHAPAPDVPIQPADPAQAQP